MMRRALHVTVGALLLAALVAPGAASGASPNGRSAQPGQEVVVWSDRSASATDEVAVVVLEAAGGIAPMAGGSKTAGCEMRGLNALGWTLWRYTLNQYFSYDGTKITYYPAGTKSTEGNWGWYDNGSTNPVKHWIVNPKSAYSIGNYVFRHDVGDLHESRSGWVRADIRGTGSWWCSAG
jgi:hypothetical protein